MIAVTPASAAWKKDALLGFVAPQDYETLKLRMREGLVEDLTEHWMTPRRAFWLAHTGSIGVNPDQRMHEDASKLCELSSSLSVGLLRASIAFVSFAGVLWGLSSDFSIPIAGRDYAVPGYMVWAAILYAAAGSALSYFVGRNLIRRNAERYAREADLRYSLVRINEHLDGISLASGEADERRRVRIDLAAVVKAMRLLVRSHTNLTWVTASFGWITNVFPVLAAAPLYFTGKISFGGLIMAASAFTHVEVALRWYVDQFSTLADWRATLLRVTGSYDQALKREVDSIRAESRAIDLQLFDALGFERVEYAHIAPLMKQQGGSRRKLSKRKDPEASVEFFIEAGFTPFGPLGGFGENAGSMTGTFGANRASTNFGSTPSPTSFAYASSASSANAAMSVGAQAVGAPSVASTTTTERSRFAKAWAVASSWRTMSSYRQRPLRS